MYVSGFSVGPIALGSVRCAYDKEVSIFGSFNDSASLIETFADSIVFCALKRPKKKITNPKRQKQIEEIS